MVRSEAPGITGIGQIGIAVADLERSTAFFRDTLGLRMLFEVPGMSFFDLGGVRLMLSGPEASGGHEQRTYIYYRVTDISRAVQAVKARGATVEREPIVTHNDGKHELWTAFVRDPDGGILALMSEVPAARPGDAGAGS